jgi:hypothetical protein
MYLGPPDFLIHDVGINLASTKLRQLAKAIDVKVKEVPVEAHHSIRQLERYHGPVRRAYDIIKDTLDGEVNKDMMLQMAVKAVNDTAGPNGLVPTLLVYGALPRLTEMDPLSPLVTKRAIAIKAATREVRQIQARRRVQDALGM